MVLFKDNGVVVAEGADFFLDDQHDWPAGEVGFDAQGAEDVEEGDAGWEGDGCLLVCVSLWECRGGGGGGGRDFIVVV